MKRFLLSVGSFMVLNVLYNTTLKLSPFFHRNLSVILLQTIFFFLMFYLAGKIFRGKTIKLTVALMFAVIGAIMNIFGNMLFYRTKSDFVLLAYYLIVWVSIHILFYAKDNKISVKSVAQAMFYPSKMAFMLLIFVLCLVLYQFQVVQFASESDLMAYIAAIIGTSYYEPDFLFAQFAYYSSAMAIQIRS